MPNSPATLTREVYIENPFETVKLPLAARLFAIGYYRFKKRWAKRLFKRPARLVFEIGYHWLKIGGQGIFRYTRRGVPTELMFNGRNGQFGGIYQFPKDHVFEAPIAALQEILLRGEAVFFDIGANWGCLSFQAASLDGFDGRIHAFEPVPTTFADLADLTRQAGLEDVITCHRIGLSDRSAQGRMVLPDGGQTGWAKVVGEGTAGAFEVELKALDDLDLPAPTLIKIDAEGLEYNILRGAEKMLQRDKPGIVFENWLAGDVENETMAPLRFLEKLGYVLYCPCWRDGPNATDGLSISNMPKRPGDRKYLTLLPMRAEHRYFGPTHWSYFAWHQDRTDELVRYFGN
jgi:FkbM family methyltransferase